MPAIKRSTILVVDDDNEVGSLIKRNLEDDNTRVFQVTNGFDCIKVLNDVTINLVVLDLCLPDFSGWGILSLLRLTKSFSRMPVIVISVDPANKSLVEQLKPDDYVQKPFDMSDLLARIRKACEQ